MTFFCNINKRKTTVKTNEKKKKARNWTKEEIELFARVIADPCPNHINTLEKKVLKKEANAEVFESILADFQRELEDENFIYENERIFSIKMERLYLTNRWNYQWLLSSSSTKN